MTGKHFDSKVYNKHLTQGKVKLSHFQGRKETLAQ